MKRITFYSTAILSMLIILACSTPIDQATSFIFDIDTVKSVGIMGWLVMFSFIAVCFSPYIYMSILKKGDKKWQQNIIETQNRTALILNQIEHSQTIILERLTTPKMSKEQLRIILNLIFTAHKLEKRKWLGSHFQEYTVTSTLDSEVEKKIIEDRFKGITKKEVNILNSLNTIQPKLGNVFWSYLDWDIITNSMINVMFDFNLSLEKRLDQCEDIMDTSLTTIEAELLK